MNSCWDNLKAECAKRETELTTEKVEQLKEFMHILLKWNEVMNLTSITEEEDIVYKHYLDSFLYGYLGEIKEASQVLDLGTGAGFPGIPLKIIFPEIEFTLMDSLKKRINFLEEVVGKLGLQNISLYHGRAEDFGRDAKHREQYDLVLSRAVAYLPILIEFTLPFVKVGKQFVAAKGPDYHFELKEGEKAIKLLGGEIKEIVEYKLPYLQDERTIIKIIKKSETPKTYPRKAGIPVKKPLI